MSAKPTHRTFDIDNIAKIEYTEFPKEAGMNPYEIYLINLWKHPLNVDDKVGDNLTIYPPELQWTEFIPKDVEYWIIQLKGKVVWLI